MKEAVITSRLTHALVFAALLASPALCGGCALTAAAVPSVTGAAPVVLERSGPGQGDSYWVARFDDFVQAALRAGEALSLKLEEKKIDEKSARLKFVGGQDMKVDLRIELWTDTVTRARVEVRPSRFSAFAPLLGQQIIEELKEADAFLVDWSNNDDPGPD